MPISASVFRRGGQKKELFEVANEDGDDEVELETKLAELVELLHTDKAGRELSAALWRPHLCAAELVKQRKQCARDMGFMRGRKMYLHVEEAVYLVDRGDLLLFVEELAEEEGDGEEEGRQQQQQQQREEGAAGAAGAGAGQPPKMRQRLLSVQEAFDLMMATGVSLERYLVYSSLSRSGYLVMRHPSRWLLGRQEEPEQVWGDGAWAGCFGRQPSAPGASPAQPMQQHLASRQGPGPQTHSGATGLGGGAQEGPGTAPAAGSGAGGGAALPMDIDDGPAAVAGPGEQRPAGSVPESEAAGKGPVTAAGRADTGAGGGEGEGGGGGSQPETGSHRVQQQQQQQQGRHPAAAAAATAAAAAAAGRPAAAPSRGWWLPMGPQHPHLAGVPERFFEELPPTPVEDRLGNSLLSHFPNLRPFPTISSALAAAAATAAAAAAAAAAAGGHAAAAPTAPTPAPSPIGAAGTDPAAAGSADEAAAAAGAPAQPASPASGPGDGRKGSIGNGGSGSVSLGDPRVQAHLLYDVYKPGSFVSRYKGQFPSVQTHVAMCSESPPTLSEMRVTDAAAAAAGGGEGGRAAPVTWAAALNGDIALYSIGKADLLPLL